MHVLFSAVVALATISGSFALEKYFFNDLPGSTWAVVSILCIFIALSISHAHMRKIKRLESISEETLIQLEEIRTRRFSSLMDLVDKNMGIIGTLDNRPQFEYSLRRNGDNLYDANQRPRQVTQRSN